MKIQVILGSTRPGRIGENVAKWVVDEASKRDGVEYELVDVADYDLPLLDEAMPAMMAQYSQEHTKKWSEKIKEADAYVFVTAEYNHSVPGALKNAIDYLNVEWKDKAVGFVGYGSAGGARAIEHLRGVAGELHMADVREALYLFLSSDFENYSEFKPTESHAEQLTATLDNLERWGGAMNSLRKG